LILIADSPSKVTKNPIRLENPGLIEPTQHQVDYVAHVALLRGIERLDRIARIGRNSPVSSGQTTGARAGDAHNATVATAAKPACLIARPLAELVSTNTRSRGDPPRAAARTASCANSAVSAVVTLS
jgi:hypothetical protein